MPFRYMPLLQQRRSVKLSNSTVTGPRNPASILRQWHNRLKTRLVHFILFLRGHERQHHGPRVSIPELFQRRDWGLLIHETGRLRTSKSPPMFHHDLLDAASKVGILEERIGYRFKDKMNGIHALKVTATNTPLYYDGMVYPVDRNNRLALLGDRVLSLAVCEMWFRTEHTNKDHSTMNRDTVSRKALRAAAYAIRLDTCMLVRQDQNDKISKDDFPETFEAVLGAVYIDAGHSLDAVKEVMHKTGLGDHEYLMTRKEYAEWLQDRGAKKGAERADAEEVIIEQEDQKAERKPSISKPMGIIQDVDVKAGMSPQSESRIIATSAQDRQKLDVQSKPVANMLQDDHRKNISKPTNLEDPTPTPARMNQRPDTASASKKAEAVPASPPPSPAPPNPTSAALTEAEILKEIKAQRPHDRIYAMELAKKEQEKLRRRGEEVDLPKLFQQIRQEMGYENVKRIIAAQISRRLAQTTMREEMLTVEAMSKVEKASEKLELPSSDVNGAKRDTVALDVGAALAPVAPSLLEDTGSLDHRAKEVVVPALVNAELESIDPLMEKKIKEARDARQLLPTSSYVGETEVDQLIGKVRNENQASGSK